MHVIAAKAVALHEASHEGFRAYSRQVVENARVLADALTERGYQLVSGGTDTHLFLVDLTNTELSGKDAENLLGKAGITVNKNTVPAETRSPFVTSGIRIGTPAVTTRGMDAADMVWIADRIDRALKSGGDETTLSGLEQEVEEFAGHFPLFELTGPRAGSVVG